jgi:hypothetical protein
MQGEEVLTSYSSRHKGGFIDPGQPLAGGCVQDPGKSDGTEATSFCVSRPVSRCSVGLLLDSFDSSGSRCTTPAR